MNITKSIKITPAWDKRSSTPSKNYGIHGCEMQFHYGDADIGVVQFVLYTNWLLPDTAEEFASRESMVIKRYPFEFWEAPLPADLGYHSPFAQYEGQDSRNDCPYLTGGTCFYDGSGLNAKEVFTTLRTAGSDGVWEELANYWKRLFEK